MSEITDDLDLYDEPCFYVEYEGGQPIWITKEGNEIKLCNMTDSHLLYSDRLVRRQIKAGLFSMSRDNEQWEGLFKKEIIKRKLRRLVL